VHTLPFLEMLRKGFPGANIDWVVEEGASRIVEGHPALRQTIVSRRNSWMKHLKRDGNKSNTLNDILQFFSELRSCRYDLVIDMQGLFKSGVLVGLSRGDRKIGMSGSREGACLFLKEAPVQVNHDHHAIDRYLKVAEYLGCDTSGWDGRIPFFGTDRRSIERILDQDGRGTMPLVAINPMARWPTKLWGSEQFATLADRISDDSGCAVAFTGSTSDRHVIDHITGMMRTVPLNLAGRTDLKELAYLYTRVKILVTTDTGPMHIAAAMGCPVVALFGPTAPWRTGPYGSRHKVIRTGVGCSPCFKKECDHMICMKEITVDEVFEGVKEMLDE